MIEMIIVIMVLVLFAAMASMRLQAFTDSRETQRFKHGLPNLVRVAATEARRSGRSQAVQYDPANASFSYIEATADTTVEPLNGNARNVITVPSDLAIESAKLGDTGVDPVEWQLVLNPDGSSEGGELTFSANGVQFLFTVSTTGNPEWLDAGQESPQAQRWQAGQLEVRGQQAP